MSTTSCERCEDFAADARKVLSQRCAPDERHCSCMPHLRAEIERLTSELEEARLTLAAEQGRAEGAPSDGWRAAGGDWSKGRARVKRSGFLWRWHIYAPQPNDHKATIASGLAFTARAAMLAADASK